MKNFRDFIAVLKDRGVDLHRAEIGRGEISLLGSVELLNFRCIALIFAYRSVQYIKKFQKAKTAFFAKRKDKKFASSAQPGESSPNEDESGQWRNDILTGRGKASDRKPGQRIGCPRNEP